MIVTSMLINISAPILHRNQKKLYVNLGKGLYSPAFAGLARAVLLCCKKWQRLHIPNRIGCSTRMIRKATSPILQDLHKSSLPIRYLCAFFSHLSL